MTMICVVNKSTKISDSDVHLMTRACASQVKLHAAPLWGLAPIPVVYHSSEKTCPPGSWVIAILDDSDQAGVLGWHTEDQGNLIYGRVFANPVLDNGGDALTRPLSVASVLSHEVLETFCDPNVNRWCDDGSGTLYALEVGDPVESDSYVIEVGGHPITVSNFVTPSWFDPQAGTHSQFDYLHNCTEPFEMTHGGYVVTMAAGKVSQSYGESYPEWRKDTKKVDTARSARRG